MGAFQSVLCQLPTAHESVRLAIGHCMLRLGREGDAEAAFARVLAVNPRSISALVASHMARPSLSEALMVATSTGE